MGQLRVFRPIDHTGDSVAAQEKMTQASSIKDLQ
jgi:hypothetical protein